MDLEASNGDSAQVEKVNNLDKLMENLQKKPEQIAYDSIDDIPEDKINTFYVRNSVLGRFFDLENRIV